jgi:hypothetical protein
VPRALAGGQALHRLACCAAAPSAALAGPARRPWRGGGRDDAVAPAGLAAVLAGAGCGRPSWPGRQALSGEKAERWPTRPARLRRSESRPGAAVARILLFLLAFIEASRGHGDFLP